VEAIAQFVKGLELLKTLPDTTERALQELQLQLLLGVSLTSLKGYTALEVEQTYSRARELCLQLGEMPQLFPALYGLASFHLVQGKFQRARELAEQLANIAEHAQDTELLIEAYSMIGTVRLYHHGEVHIARTYLERAITFYDQQLHHAHRLRFGQDSGITARVVVAVNLWCAGYPDQALKRLQEALTLAQHYGHPYEQAISLGFGSFLYQYRGEGHLTREPAAAAVALSTEHEFALTLIWGMILQGWALIEEGQSEQGIAQIQQGITAQQAMGAELFLPYFRSLLAEAHRRTGQAAAGLRVLDEAFAAVETTDAHLYEAELYRLKGELTLQSGVPRPGSEVQQEAEECFHKAIEIARQQQAKSLELRAVMSLARLWQQQGERDEGHRMLFEIYNWFTEGFDTKDLQGAKVLLDGLS